MNMFKNMTLGKKIIGGFCIMVFIITVLGYLGYFNVKKLGGQIQEVGEAADIILEDQVPLADAAMESTIALTSSYCGLTGHGRKATRSGHIQNNGMIMAEVVDGRLGRVVPLVKSLDLRTKEEL